MEERQFAMGTGDRRNDMEASILSAHKKFFGSNSESLGSLDGAEAVLYDSVIRYFMGNS